MTAADKILRKALVGSSLNAAQWSRVQAGLRDRAFFSATVENVRFLHAARAAVAAHAAGGASLSETRRELRDALLRSGYERPEDGAGTVRDLLTQRRLDLVVRTNVQQARGWKQYVEGSSPGALAAYPAQRLVRVRERRMPRNWEARWRLAGDAVGWQGASRGQMAALKTSPIWARLSRFGNPFPPFDFNSGMGLEDVGRRRTVELGLATREELGEMVEKAKETPPPGFNDNLQAEIAGVRHDSEEGRMLREAFGDQIRIDNGVVRWQGNIIQDVVDGKVKKARLGKISARTLGLMRDALTEDESSAFEKMEPSFLKGVFEQHASKHYEGNERRSTNIPLTRWDYDLMPTVWREPERIIRVKKGHAVLEMETLDGGYLQLSLNVMHGFSSFYKTKSPLEALAANARLPV